MPALLFVPGELCFDFTQEFRGNAQERGDLMLWDTLRNSWVFCDEIQIPLFGRLRDSRNQTVHHGFMRALDHNAKHAFKFRNPFIKLFFVF